jgi:hypothetical protein
VAPQTKDRNGDGNPNISMNPRRGKRLRGKMNIEVRIPNRIWAFYHLHVVLAVKYTILRV